MCKAQTSFLLILALNGTCMLQLEMEVASQQTESLTMPRDRCAMQLSYSFSDPCMTLCDREVYLLCYPSDFHSASQFCEMHLPLLYCKWNWHGFPSSFPPPSLRFPKKHHKHKLQTLVYFIKLIFAFTDVTPHVKTQDSTIWELLTACSSPAPSIHIRSLN